MKQLEKKTIAFATESFDEEQGIFEGHGAVFGNVDDGGDVIEPGAFTKTIAENMANDRVKILALHNDEWLPIGKPIELREDAQGLYIKARISDTTLGRDVKILIKDRVLTELSIGYEPVVGGFDYDENGIRHLRELDLWEVSPVTWAMNAEAAITGYKSLMLTESKEGRKISKTRLKMLKDARDALDVMIKEVEPEEDKNTAKARVNPLLKKKSKLNWRNEK